VQPDEEDIQLRDPEELRNDKATKISKKEVIVLISIFFPAKLISFEKYR
jgi:hypothetical protein